jgi:hypothetical protein
MMAAPRRTQAPVRALDGRINVVPRASLAVEIPTPSGYWSAVAIWYGVGKVQWQSGGS